MSAYLVLSFFFLIVSIFPFNRYIIITGASIVPLALFLLSIFQSFIFKSMYNAKEDPLVDDTMYSTRDRDKQKEKRAIKYHAGTKAFILPPLLLLIVYFSSAVKIIASIAMYLLSFIVIRMLMKLTNK